MKKNILCCFSLLFFYSVHSQSLIIKGRIKCLNQNVNSTKGAENIVVVPAFMPSQSTITVTNPAGYFECNTGVPYAKIQDKEVSIYVISRCAECKEQVKRVFVSEDQDRQNKDDAKHYLTIKEWMLNTNCQKAELVPKSADSILNVVVKQPGQDLDKVSSASALAGAPAFLNLLTDLATVAAAVPPGGVFTIQKLQPGKINYGQFLLASPLFHSANTGFNFAPSRDLSEAFFWNPSAIAFSRKPNNISLLTNLKNNAKAGGFLQLTEKLSLGGGFIYTMQDEFRRADFKDVNNNNSPPRSIDSVSMKLNEYAAFISPVFKVNKKLSIALTIKSLWQHFNTPNQLFIDANTAPPTSTFTDSTINKQHFDVDISATYKISSSFQAGINLMNLAGTELYADAFVPGQAVIPMQKQRSLGFGLIYKWQRLNVGADLLFTEDGFYDASFGINYVPFNNALLSAGIAVKQLSYSFAFRIKHFRIAYINDNDFLINEKRTGKINLLDGKIYGGFIFDL